MADGIGVVNQRLGLGAGDVRAFANSTIPGSQPRPEWVVMVAAQYVANRIDTNTEVLSNQLRAAESMAKATAELGAQVYAINSKFPETVKVAIIRNIAQFEAAYQGDIEIANLMQVLRTDLLALINRRY